MAEIVLHDPLFEVHGKLSKKNGRVEYMQRRDSGVRYTSMKKEMTRREKQARKAQATENQLNVQKKFAAVAKATRTRMADSSKMAADLAAFKKQSKYSTLYGYIFADEYQKTE